jgi:hypothetical protein
MSARAALLLALLAGLPGFAQETSTDDAPAVSYSTKISGEVLHANTLEFAGLAFRDVVATPRYSGQSLSFLDCQATAYGGKVTGSVELNLATGVYHCHCRISEIDLGTVLSEFGGNNANVTGIVSGWANFDIPARHVAAMTGKGEITVTHGSLVQLPLLANLLVGDPSNSKGKDSASASFEFRVEQISILSGQLNSPACKIAIRGNVGFDGNLHLLLTPWFKFNLVDGVPGLGPIVAPMLSSMSSRVARAILRGQITHPILVINPFVHKE